MATLLITLLAVVGASVVGYSLVTGGGDDDAQDEDAPVQLSVWVDQASSACHSVAEEHPLLSQGASAREDADNVAAVEAGFQSLVDSVRGLPPLVETDDAEQVDAVVAIGEPAATAWQELESADDVSGDQLTEASELTTAFVAGLVDLGADCGVLD